MSIIKKLDGIIQKFNDLEKKLMDSSSLGQELAKISKEHSDLSPIVELAKSYKKSVKELDGIDEMLL